MPDYKALYEQLFDAMTDAIESLRKAQLNAADTCSEELKKERNEILSTKIKADFGSKLKED